MARKRSATLKFTYIQFVSEVVQLGDVIFLHHFVSLNDVRGGLRFTNSVANDDRGFISSMTTIE